MNVPNSPKPTEPRWKTRLAISGLVTANWSPKPPTSRAIAAAALTPGGRSSSQRKRRAAPASRLGAAAGSIRRDSQARTAITPANEAASTKNTAVSPLTAMTIPATPGPAILASPVTVANREPPRRSWSGPTRLSMNVWRAGRSTHWTQPITNESGTRYASVISPASSGIPIASAPAACRPWVIIATRTARCLATMVPARRLNSSIGRH